MPFQYNTIYTTHLSDSFWLEVWQCHVDTLEQYAFNLELVDSNGNVLGMSAGDGQWYDTKAACEAAGRLFYLMQYSETES